MIILLLSILDLSEKTYSIFGVETGGVNISGFISVLIENSLLLANCFDFKKVIKRSFNHRIFLLAVAILFIIIVISILIENKDIIMINTLSFVLFTIILLSSLFANVS